MLPHNCSHLFTLAAALNVLIADEATPKALRRLLIKFIQKLKKKLPPVALREVQAVEAEAVVRGADYLRFSRRSVS